MTVVSRYNRSYGIGSCFLNSIGRTSSTGKAISDEDDNTANRQKKGQSSVVGNDVQNKRSVARSIHYIEKFTIQQRK